MNIFEFRRLLKANWVNGQSTLDRFTEYPGYDLTDIDPLFDMTRCDTITFITGQLGSEPEPFDAKANLSLPPLTNAEDASDTIEVNMHFSERDGRVYFELWLGLDSAGVTLETFFGGLPQSRVVEEGFYVYKDSILKHFQLISAPNNKIRLTANSDTAYTDMPFTVENARIFFTGGDGCEWKIYEKFIESIGDDYYTSIEISGRAGLPDGFSFEDSMPFELKVNLGEVINDMFQAVSGSAASLPCDVDLYLVSGEEDPDGESFERISLAYITIQMQPGGFTTPVKFTVPLFGSNNYWPLTADFETGLGISDIINFFGSLAGLDEGGGELLPTDSMPADILDFFELYRLRVGANVGANFSMSLSDMQALFSISKPWNLPIPKASLDSLNVLWQVTWGSGLDEYLMTAHAAGQLSFGIGDTTLKLNASADLPDMDMEAHLVWSDDPWESPEEQITLSQLAGEMGAGIPQDWGSGNADAHPAAQNQLGRLDVYASPGSRSFSIYAELDDLIQFSIGDLPVNLKKIFASADIKQGSKAFSLGGSLSFNEPSPDNPPPEGAEQPQPFSFDLEASYDNGDWWFEGGLGSGEVNLLQLVEQVMQREIPDSDKDTGLNELELTDLYMGISGKGDRFKIETGIEGGWNIEVLGKNLAGGAKGYIHLEKEKTEGNQSSLFAAAMLMFQLGAFKVAAQVDDFFDKNNREFQFQVQFKDLYAQATYGKKKVGNADHHILTLSLGGMSFGEVVESLIRQVNPNQGFKLTGPWAALNDISLSDISLQYDMTDESVSLLYQVNKSIPGIMEIEKVGVTYKKAPASSSDKKVFMVLTGKFLGESYSESNPLTWDAVDGQPPATTGSGPLFDLSFLGMGYKLDLSQVMAGASTKDKTNELKELLRDNGTDQKPNIAFSDSTGFFAGTEFELLGGLRSYILIAHPELYGVRIEVDKDASGAIAMLKGLLVDLQYQKVSESVGMFRAEFMVPDTIKRLDFGTFVIILGKMYAEVYTDGKFYIDFGFPKGDDFSKSFGLFVGVFGGYGGIKLGYLDAASAKNLPAVQNGAFTTVLLMGLGLSLGIERTFEGGFKCGVTFGYKIGASLMLYGIFDGLLAFYQPKGMPSNQSLYYSLNATIGVVGEMVVYVGFKNLGITLYAKAKASAAARIEAYKAIKMSLDLEVTVAGQLGPFKFNKTLRLHLAIEVGSDSNPPWITRGRTAGLTEGGIKFNTGRLGDDKSIRMFEMRLLPIFSIENPTIERVRSNGEADYCVAFIPCMRNGEFGELLGVMANWLTQSITQGGVITKEQAEASSHDDILNLNYDMLDVFLQNNVTFDVQTRWEELRDLIHADDMVALPMPPPLAMYYRSEGPYVVERSFQEWNPVPENYMEFLDRYLGQFNADPNNDSYGPVDPSGFAFSNNRVPISKLVFLNYFHMLLMELHSNLGGQFNERSMEAGQLIPRRAELGISAEEILMQNPELEIQPGRIQFPNLEYITKENDRLINIMNSYGMTKQNILSGVLNQAMLIDNSGSIMLEGITFYGEGLQLRQAAALYFSRYLGDCIEDGYQYYANLILENNPGISQDWVDTGTSREIILPVDGTPRWYTRLGDTVRSISRMCYLLEAGKGIIPKWDEFYTRFKAANDFSDNTPDHINLRGDGWRLPRVEIPVKSDINISSLRTRLTVESRHEGLIDDAITAQLPLTPLTPISLKNASISIETATKLKDLVSARHISVKDLAGAFESGGFRNYNASQTLTATIKNLPVDMYISDVTGDDFVGQTAALASRFLLQGLRLPDINELNKTTGFYKFTGQQFPVARRSPISVDLYTSRAWLNAGLGGYISPDIIDQMLPESYVQIPGSLFEQEKAFEPVEKYFSSSTGYLHKRKNSERSDTIHKISDGLHEAMLMMASYPAITDQRGGSVAGRWGCLVPIAVTRVDGDPYTFNVYGADAENRQTLIKALNDLGDYLNDPFFISVNLMYKSPSVSGMRTCLVSDELNRPKCSIIQTNLSVETHRKPVIRSAGGYDHIATMQEGNATKFIRLLWECSVVGGGGYYLRIQNINGQPLPTEIFDSQKQAQLYLMIGIENNYANGPALGYNKAVNWINCVMVRNTTELGEVINFTTGLDEYQPAHPRWSAVMKASAEIPAHIPGDKVSYTRELFSIGGYRLLGQEPFMASGDSSPILPYDMGGHWEYKTIVPLSRFLLDPRYPYDKVGEGTMLHFTLRDVLGNQAETIGWDSPAVLKNNEKPIGLHQWPGQTITYRVVRDLSTGKPAVEINFIPLEDKDRLLKDSAKMLIRAYNQLHYSGTRLSVRTTLRSSDINITDNQRVMLLNHITNLIQYLSGDTSAKPGPLSIILPVAEGIEALPKGPFPIKLDMAISIDGLPSGISEVVSSITPHDEISSVTDQDTNLKAFVRGAESVYQGLHIAYKKDENELYGVTMGENGYITQASFGHYSTGTPEFLAFKPLSTRFMTRPVNVKDLDASGILNESPEKKVFADIDMHRWGETFLEDYENMLRADITSLAGEKAADELNNLINLKKELAQAVSKQLTHIKSGSQTPIDNARKLMKDRLMRNAAYANDIDIVTQYKVKINTNSGLPAFRFTTRAVVDSDKCTAESSKIGTYKNPSEDLQLIVRYQDEYIQINPGVKLVIDEMEYNISDQGEYESSDWLKFIYPVEINDGNYLQCAKLWPHPEKSLPETPTLMGHSVELGSGGERWNYKLNCYGKAAPQDSWYIRVDLKKKTPEFGSVPLDLFDHLAQYMHVREPLLEAIQQRGESFANAYGTFRGLASGIAISWNAWVDKEAEPAEVMPDETDLPNTYYGKAEFTSDSPMNMTLANISCPLGYTAVQPYILPGRDGSYPSFGDKSEFVFELRDISTDVHDCAKPSVYIVRNENILSGAAVNPAFIFRTTTAGLEWIYALAESAGKSVIGNIKTGGDTRWFDNGELLTQIRDMLDNEETLCEYVRGSDARASRKEAHGSAVDIAVSYQYRLNMNPNSAQVSIPIGGISKRSGEPLSFDALPELLRGWLSSSVPSITGASLVFDIATGGEAASGRKRQIAQLVIELV